MIKEFKKVISKTKSICCFLANDPGPSLGGLNDFEYKENFKAILQQELGLQTGDLALMVEQQDENFTFTFAGKKYSKPNVLDAFRNVWLTV